MTDMLVSGPGNFLDGDDLESLLALTIFPDFFPAARGYEDIDWPGRFKHPYTSPGPSHALAPEDLLAFELSTLMEIEEVQRVTASFAMPWAPRGETTVPIFQNGGMDVLDVVVPIGYQWWIDGYAMNLFPSTANELNYRWQLLVNGRDIINQGNAAPAPGRPVQDPGKVTIGRTKSQMYLAQPGARVQVVVTALNTIGASDSVSACVFGQLEGIHP